MATSPRETTKRVQRVLSAFDSSVAVDGVLGPVTRASYDQAIPVLKLGINKLLEINGYSDMDQLSKADVSTPAVDAIDRAEALAILARAADSIGQPSLVSYLTTFMDKEAAKVNRNPNLYKISSRNGSSRGLMQIQPGAWLDSQKWLKSHAPSVRLGDYDSNVYVPSQNILAGVVYAAINKEWMEKHGVPVNPETLYISHNQGLGFWRGTRTNISGQSAEGRALFEKYANVKAK